MPLAVSAVSGDTMQNTGAVDIRGLNQVSPSLLVSSTSSEAGASVARIRGIGTVGDNAGLESSVAVFIDGVYRSRTAYWSDRARAGRPGRSVARTAGHPVRPQRFGGPDPRHHRQAPLYARNLWRSDDRQLRSAPHRTWRHRPDHGQLAARIDAVWMQRDGFLEDVISGGDYNDRNRWLLRGQMLYQPNDNLSVRLIGDYRQAERTMLRGGLSAGRRTGSRPAPTASCRSLRPSRAILSAAWAESSSTIPMTARSR